MAEFWIDFLATCIPVQQRFQLATYDSPQLWHDAFSTHIISAVTLYEFPLPSKSRKTKGDIISTSSVSGRIADFTSSPSPFGSFKAAHVRFKCQLAHKYASKGIKINSMSCL